MKKVSSKTSIPAADLSIDEIDALLEQLSQRARTESNADAFYGQLLETSVVAIDATAVAVWSPVPARQLAPLRQYRLESAYSVPVHEVVASESERFWNVLKSDRAASYPANAASGLACAVLACPLRDSTRNHGVLAIYLAEDTPASAREQLLEFAKAMAAVALEFELYRQVAGIEDIVQLARQAEAFSLRVHQPWNPSDAALEVANEGRRLIGCDRVTVLVRRGRKWCVAAVSGVNQFDKRSREVRQLQELVGVVARFQQPLIYCGGSAEMPPQVEASLSRYLEGAASRELVVAPAVPPSSSGSTFAPSHVAIVAEQYFGRLPLELVPRIELVTEHAALALPRASALHRFPFRLLRRATVEAGTPFTLSRIGSLLILVALSAAVYALAAAQTDFRVLAHGRLQPVARQWVFAPADGIVAVLTAEHGKKFSQGEPLLQLRSPELELSISQVEGQLDTARQELAMIHTAELQHAAVNSSSDVEASELVARHLTVEDRIRNLESQLKILTAKKNALVVTSPISGTVLNWQPARYLASRPVERGAALVEIGDLAGQWVAELDVADRSAGHVLQAMNEKSGGVPVSFVIATNPGQPYDGTIAEAAETTHLDEHGESAIRVNVDVDEQTIADLRHGAAIVAKIDCGRRSVGYVWFHELWEELERRFF